MNQFRASFGDELVKIAAKEKKKKKSLLRKAVTVAAGGAAAYGAYRYGRKIRLSKDPLLRRMQEKAKGRSSIVDVLPAGSEKLKRPPKEIERIFRAGDDLHEIPEAAAIDRANKVMVGKAEPLKIKGAIQTAADPHELKGIKSDLALSSTPKEFAEGKIADKLQEAKYLEATGIGAKSESAAGYMEKVKAGAPKSDMAALDELQATLSKKYPNGYVVKPIGEAYAPGVPTHKQRFADILGPNGNPEHKKWMRGVLDKSDDYMVQEYIPIAKERGLLAKRPVKPGEAARKVRLGGEVPTEYRVHVYGGKVVPGATVHRWAGGAELNPFRRKEIQQMEAEIQKAIGKLPGNRTKIPMAMDVVKDTSGKWRIIEANIGTQSGFMGPQVGRVPIPSKPAHALYKATTGRQSKLEAGLKATAAGVGGTAAAAKMTSGSPMQGEA